MRKFLLILACLVSAIAADVPRRAPGFALPDSKMRIFDLYDYRGKIVLLEFMQTTCPHCAVFADKLAAVQQKYGEKVQVLAVANMAQDNDRTVAAYIAGHKVTYPILFDAGQMAYSYILNQQIQYPQVFLIDANGIIQKQFEYGPMSRDIFEGNGLVNEVDRLVAAAATKKK